MASVRLKKTSDHYFACYKLPTGKNDARGLPVFRRVQRSTGTADKARAQQMAISFERAAIAAGEKRWTENAGRKFLAELNALSGVSVAEVEPAGDFLRRWLRSRERGLGPASYIKYSHAVTSFLGFIGESATMSDITSKRVSEFRDLAAESGKGPATINNTLMILRQAFNEATMQRILEVNPAAGLNLRGVKRASQHRSAFTFAQFRELVRCTGPDYQPDPPITRKDHEVNPDWQTLIMVCGYTGARQQEAAQLDWAQVDLAGMRMTLTLTRTKTDDTHWLPLHASLAAHLTQRWAEAGKPQKGQVLPGLSANRRSLSNKFRRSILPRIGIVQEFATGNGKGRKLAAYSIHSLRHSLATWLADAGVEESMRMQLIGHEDESVNRGYTHTKLNEAAAALGKIPEI